MTQQTGRLLFILIAVTILSIGPMRLRAQPFSFQAFLTDNNGVELNGIYDFEFALFDAPAAGAQVGPQNFVIGHPVTDGLLNLELDMGSVFAGSDLWLEIGMRDGLSPGPYEIQGRSKITYAPRAVSSTRVDSLIFLDAGGDDIEFRSPYDMRFYLDRDNAIPAEYFTVYNGAGDVLLRVVEDGSFIANHGTGDHSVVLPPGSISSTERIDEAGIASDVVPAVWALGTNALTTISSVSLNAPSSGYALVIASADILVLNPAGQAAFAITDNSTVMPLDSVEVTEDVPMTMHRVFGVSPGLNTFYLLAREAIDDVRAKVPRLTAIFVPTPYGTVETASPAAVAERSDGAGLTEADIANSRAAAIEADQARIQRELEDIRVQIEQLTAEAAAKRP